MTDTHANAIAIRPAQCLDRYAYEPQDIEAAWARAKALHASGMFAHIKTPEQAFLILQQGRELGLQTMAAITSIDIIQGKPSLSAKAMVGMIKGSPACVYLSCTHSTDESATWETQRAGSPHPVACTYTLDQAKAMGLTQRDGWKRQPKVMLMWRAASQLARMEYPDIVQGLYDPDELAD